MSTTAEPKSPSTRRGAFARHSGLYRQLAPLAVLVALLAIVSIMQPNFLLGTGVQILFYQALPILLLALGQLFVIIIGGIDLSSAAVAIFTGVVVAQLLGSVGALAPVIALVIGAAAGALNGIIITYYQVPSFAVTLGALGVWQAVALIVSNESTVYISDNAEVITWLTDYEMSGLQLCVWLGLLLAVLAWALMRWTRLGTTLRAVGLNELGAKMSNVAVGPVKVTAFALSGMFAAVAGIVLTAQQGTASASGLGIGLLLPSIAAAVAGGAAITGGIGNPLNVIVGALIIALVPVGSAAVGIEPRYQQIVYGVVVILAVIATIDRSKLQVIK